MVRRRGMGVDGLGKFEATVFGVVLYRVEVRSRDAGSGDVYLLVTIFSEESDVGV